MYCSRLGPEPGADGQELSTLYHVRILSIFRVYFEFAEVQCNVQFINHHARKGRQRVGKCL